MDTFGGRLIRSKPNAKTTGASSRKRKTIGKKSFILALPRVFRLLSIPQLSILFAPLYEFLLPAQYTLRIHHTYKLLKWCTNIETKIGRWLNAILDFLPFILAAHLYGALWYRLSLQREVDCWGHACHDKRAGCDLAQTGYPSILVPSFYCGVDITSNKSHLNITHIKASCPINPPDATIFDFGIFLYALQSDLTRSTSIKRNFLQSFWWGLRNLSSLGSNLQTSLYWGEIVFSIFVSISGMVLFLLYLNTRIQMSQQRSSQLKLRQKMQMMNLDIDLWLYKNALCDKNLKMVITKNLHQKLEENKEVDVENVLSLIPIIHQRRILRHLSLNLLKKVPMLENMNENVLKAICEHLKFVKYSEDKYIVREGEPLDKMLFITQGTAWSYPTNASGSSAIKCLVKGDFYGEELLNWASELSSFSEFPKSTRIVKAHTKVEAFAIRANNLNIVVSTFWWHFSKRLGHIEESQLERWQHLAACSIQAKWRRRHARPV
ncbi:PREDICTED: cyclic nucleotide-gated ion channel 1-like [Prunus mume]|uniref:Cyclic nucleotide-gated ion channel 1-like n=1 Tax=Prunus mume TaxID=102107 RepID=A0ABM0PP50_PRUMU|nr:PREDICTED: cyclic nucleotide-gated ion channel 1-like [Prunus mume]